MNKILVALVVVIALLSQACASMSPDRDYCDTEMAYELWKQETGYRLHLHIGDALAQSCVLHSDKSRAVNLIANVTTVAEALKLVEEHRQKYEARHKSVATPSQARK